jgi:hypothetical protein
MPPWYVRLWCRLFGHVAHLEQRADPVIPMFWICNRCGKFGRTADVIVKVRGS